MGRRCRGTRMRCAGALFAVLLILGRPRDGPAARAPTYEWAPYARVASGWRGPTVPIVLMPGCGYNIFRSGYAPKGECATLGKAAPRGWWALFWADNQARYSDPDDDYTLQPWDDDAGWTMLCMNLAQASRYVAENHGLGIALDGEIYTASPDNNGGHMDPVQAWRTHPRARERGRAFGQAVSTGGPLQAGCMVSVLNVTDEHPGWEQFWSGVAESAPGLLLDETFISGKRSLRAARSLAREWNWTASRGVTRRPRPGQWLFQF
jgi:hypothetical protein